MGNQSVAESSWKTAQATAPGRSLGLHWAAQRLAAPTYPEMRSRPGSARRRESLLKHPCGESGWSYPAFQDQVQQRPVHVITMIRLENSAGPAVFDDPKGAFKIPQGKTPAKFAVETQQIPEPAHGHVVRRAVETAALADMHPHSRGFYLKPGLVIAVSYTHLRAHETRHDLVCRLL